MNLDPTKNYLFEQLNAGINSAVTSLTLTSGGGANMIDPSTNGEYNVVIWEFSNYRNPADDPNAEIVRVEVVVGDVVTIARPVAGNNYHGEGSGNTAQNHNTGGETYKLARVFSKNDYDNIVGLNYKIVSTVSSNNLTVALKDCNGNDPSISNPIAVKIGDTVRKITAPLSVTKNAGTNWFNSGSSELATKEIDYFTYLGFNATDGIVIGFSRIPHAEIYSDFSTTTTNEQYAGISTIANAVATDNYVNIGRFSATLSAGAGYNWSVPTFTGSNLIQRPIYETRTLAWIPVWTGFSVDPSSVEAIYKIKGNQVFVKIATAVGTSNATNFIHTLPFSPVQNQSLNIPFGFAEDGGTGITSPGRVNLESGSSNAIIFSDLFVGAWTNSGNKRVHWNGDYQLKIS